MDWQHWTEINRYQKQYRQNNEEPTTKYIGNSTSTVEDFISLQLVSYPFVLFCMAIKYAKVTVDALITN